MKSCLYLILFAFLQNFIINSCDPLQATPVGALLSIQFSSNVGFLLDEIPGYSLEEVKDYIQNSVNKQEWITRAKMQIFANTGIAQSLARLPKLQLPISPEQVWKIDLTGEPYEATVHGHHYIMRNYSFHSMVTGRADTMNASEPVLTTISGKYSNYFIQPVDPEHIFQRTGYACADESYISLDTGTSENIIYGYFNQNCRVEPFLSIKNLTYELNQKNFHS